MEPAIHFLSYSDDRFGHKGGRFRANQLRMIDEARAIGITHIVEWTFDRLSQTDFYREHKSFLDKDRFHNGAAFKPYIVLQTLRTIPTGDVLFYYDCGDYRLTRPLTRLARLCRDNGGTLFHEWGDRNAMWTKRDAFVLMGCDTPRYHDNTALQNTWFFMEKTDACVRFAEEWLAYNLDERIASYVMPSTCGLPELPGFRENRGDQSIFTNLSIRYGIRTFAGATGPLNRQIDNFLLTLTATGRFVVFLKRAVWPRLPEPVADCVRHARDRYHGIRRALRHAAPARPRGHGES